MSHAPEEIDINGSHVIIRGYVFSYAEKSPFMSSGKSVLGAVEYNEHLDVVKCHECGIWIKGLGGHIKIHGIRRVDYNKRHGLRGVSALSSLSTRSKHSSLAIRQVVEGTGIVSSKVQERRSASRHGGKLAPRSIELHNQNGRCAAQMLYRIQVCAAQCGHTPTKADLREAGLSVYAIGDRFGSLGAAMRLAGLQDNLAGGRASALPKTFPSKEDIETRWNERMAWPVDYLDAGLIGLEQKRRD